ncbi:hypothetical protein ACH5RR_034929 [Cinchona calisaya]|uniref:Uncharacterized protein n=1 Tax=Cinchona calisaya TaxID=153742 RepID=A0ABD2YDI2_9GENT
MLKIHNIGFSSKCSVTPSLFHQQIHQTVGGSLPISHNRIKNATAVKIIEKAASVVIVVADATETTQPLEMPLQSLTIDAPNFTATANQHCAVAPTISLSVALHLIVDDVAIHFWGGDRRRRLISGGGSRWWIDRFEFF